VYTIKVFSKYEYIIASQNDLPPAHPGGAEPCRGSYEVVPDILYPHRIFSWMRYGGIGGYNVKGVGVFTGVTVKGGGICVGGCLFGRDVNVILWVGSVFIVGD